MSTDLFLRAKQFVREHVSPKRYQHSLRTAETAAKLAELNGVDENKAYLAGVLHDIGRDLSSEKVVSLAKNHYTLEEWELENPVLLHGKAAAALARDGLGIEDEDILEALACHTTGAPGMGPVARVVYISDTIEPKRKHITPKFRKWVFSVRLFVALEKIVKEQLEHLEKKNAVVAGITRELYNEVVKEVEESEAAEKN